MRQPHKPKQLLDQGTIAGACLVPLTLAMALRLQEKKHNRNAWVCYCHIFLHFCLTLHLSLPMCKYLLSGEKERKRIKWHTVQCLDLSSDNISVWSTLLEITETI